MPKKGDEDIDISKLARKAMRDEEFLDELLEGNLGKVIQRLTMI